MVHWVPIPLRMRPLEYAAVPLVAVGKRWSHGAVERTGDFMEMSMEVSWKTRQPCIEEGCGYGYGSGSGCCCFFFYNPSSPLFWGWSTDDLAFSVVETWCAVWGARHGTSMGWCQEPHCRQGWAEVVAAPSDPKDSFRYYDEDASNLFALTLHRLLLTKLFDMFHVANLLAVQQHPHWNKLLTFPFVT